MNFTQQYFMLFWFWSIPITIPIVRKKVKSEFFSFTVKRKFKLFWDFGCQSFRTQVISYLLWSFRTSFLVISYPVTTISYPGHFVPSLVISYLGQLGTKWLYGGQFVPKCFRTLFGHFVPILVISYRAKMDGLTNGLTDRRVLIEITN